MLENSHAWMGGTSSSIADSYQYQLQSMWQKCWNTNQNLMHHLRFRERGPLKSWRPETMAEAIFSVLKEGLSLSQAARKYDIPYPTFVLYANRVHNMLGPSIDGGPDMRPKGRGRPQRILLGIWPDEHIKGVIKTVVFRDAKDLKEEGLTHIQYGRHSPIFPFQDIPPLGYGGPVAGANACPNGIPGAQAGEQMSQEATAAAVAAVAHNLRQQMQMAAAAHHHPDSPQGPNLFNLPPHLQPHLGSAAAGGPREPPMPGPGGPGGIPLPKASISPALGSATNPTPGRSLIDPRHGASPCGPGLAGLPNIPPGMAAALAAGGGAVAGAGRCDPTMLLSQQQQHQLQQLHLQQQQQQALHQQQKSLGFALGSLGPHSSSTSATSTSSTSHPLLQQQHEQSDSSDQQGQQLSKSRSDSENLNLLNTDKASGSSSSRTLAGPSSRGDVGSSGGGGSRSSSTVPSESPLFGDLDLEMTYKALRGNSGTNIGGSNVSGNVFSPGRLFPDDLAALVSGVTSCTANTSTTTTVAHTISSSSSSTSSNASGSNSIKIEPISTTSD